MEKKLTKDTNNRLIGGVASGLAKYFGFDTSLVRILWAVSCLFNNFTAVFYIILWICLPKEDPYADRIDEIEAPSKRGGCIGIVILLGLIIIIPIVLAIMMLMFVFALCGVMNQYGI